MRKLLCFCLLLCACPAWADEIMLDVKGTDVKVVKVDKTVVVKVDVTVVGSLPFSVVAPEGSALYFWTYPPGVTAADKGDTLEVTAAPKGALTISVKAISAKLDAGGKFVGFITQHGAVTFSVGGVEPPTPPTDPIPAALLSAWQQESSTSKLAQVQSLAMVYRDAVEATANDPSLTTIGGFYGAFKTKVNEKLAVGALPKLRPAIGAELSKVLPTAANTPLDAQTRALIATQYTRIAGYLEELK